MTNSSMVWIIRESPRIRVASVHWMGLLAATFPLRINCAALLRSGGRGEALIGKPGQHAGHDAVAARTVERERVADGQVHVARQTFTQLTACAEEPGAHRGLRNI